MNSEVHNDTAPDSGGGVSAFETMVTQSHIGDCNISRKNTSREKMFKAEDANCNGDVHRYFQESTGDSTCIHRNRLDQQYRTFIFGKVDD